MKGDPLEDLYTIIITAVRDDAARARVARTLVRITRNLPVDKITAKLDSLPWTLTRRAPQKTAARLVQLLEKAGAAIKVLPPLAVKSVPEMEQTQILPDTKLLSETQVSTATQYLKMPGETRQAPTAARPPQLAPPPKKVTESDDAPSGEGVEIEPLTIGGILDRTFQICRTHFWKLLAIVGIPWVITTIIALVLTIAVAVVGLTVKNLGNLAPWLLIVAGVAVIPSVIVVLVGLFYLSQGALIYAVSSIYLGKEVLVKGAYRFVLSRLGRFFLTSCLFVLAACGFVAFSTLIGALLFGAFKAATSSGWWSAVTWPFLAVIPMYGITKLLLFDKVVIIEDEAYGKALKRSWHLLTGKADSPWPRGFFLRLVILINLFFLINMAISIVFRTPGAVFSLLLSEPQWLGAIVNQVLTSIGSLVAGVFGSVCMVVFYYDIRNRKEGFDLKMLAGLE